MRGHGRLQTVMEGPGSPLSTWLMSVVLPAAGPASSSTHAGVARAAPLQHASWAPRSHVLPCKEAGGGRRRQAEAGGVESL